MESQPETVNTNARVRVRINTGAADVGSRRRINVIGGTNVAITGTDDSVNEEVDLTFAVASAAPSGNAGGDLTGTYPNPTIGVGKVTSAAILDGTIATADIANLAITTALVADAAITNAKVAAEAWSTWVPVLTADGGSPTIGNATVSARYQQRGKTVHAEFHLILGSTTNFGTGTLYCTLPVTARASSLLHIGSGAAYDADTAQRYICAIELASSTTVKWWHPTNGGVLTQTGTVPFTWSTVSDQLAFSITYEAA